MTTVFTCADNFESMMTCIYTAWASRLGHDNVRLLREPVDQYDLFCNYIHVDADGAKAESVANSIIRKISPRAAGWIDMVLRSEAEDALDTVYRFLVLGFHIGGNICDALQNPVVARMMEIQREVSNNAYRFKEFLRFNSIDDKVYIAHMEPKADVVDIVARHFVDRMNICHWIIVDDKRRKAAIHPSNEEFYIRYLTDSEFKQLSGTETYEDSFTALWKDYFETIEIKQRHNPACQRNHFPLWARKHITEFR